MQPYFLQLVCFMRPIAEETKTENKEQFIKIAENDYVLVLAIADKKQFGSYLIPHTTEDNFIKKIIASSVLNPKNKNPGYAVGRAMEVSPLEGIKHVLHAKVQNKHRILLIMRYVHFPPQDKLPPREKLVVLFLQDDRNHKLSLNSIKQSHKQKRYDCGSNIHWSKIIEAINNNHYQVTPAPIETHEDLKPLPKEPLAAETKEDPTSTATVATSDQQDQTEAFTSQDNGATEGALVEKNPAEVCQGLNVEHEKKNTFEEASSEEMSIMQATKKKKKKKKKTISDFELTGIHEGIYAKFKDDTEFLSLVNTVLCKNNGHETMLEFLNCGMNPDICDVEGTSFLRVALISKKIKVVELLLDRGASLTFYGEDDGELCTYLSLFISLPEVISNFNGSDCEYREILKLLIQKTKEAGTLDTVLSPKYPITVLYQATASLNLVAVEELHKAGVDATVRSGPQGLTPAEFAKKELVENRNLKKQGREKLRSILQLVQTKEKIAPEVLALMQNAINKLQKKVEQSTKQNSSFYQPGMFQTAPITVAENPLKDTLDQPPIGLGFCKSDQED